MCKCRIGRGLQHGTGSDKYEQYKEDHIVCETLLSRLRFGGSFVIFTFLRDHLFFELFPCGVTDFLDEFSLEIDIHQ